MHELGIQPAFDVMPWSASLNSLTLKPDLLIISRKVPLARYLPWCTGTVSEGAPHI